MAPTIDRGGREGLTEYGKQEDHQRMVMALGEAVIAIIVLTVKGWPGKMAVYNSVSLAPYLPKLFDLMFSLYF